MPDTPESKTCEFSTIWPPDPCGKPAVRAYGVGSIYYVTCDDPEHDAAIHELASEFLHTVAGGEPDVIIFDAASNSWVPQGTSN